MARPRTHPQIACAECGEEFSPIQIIEGRTQRLYHRRKCLSCQPYKASRRGVPLKKKRTFNPPPGEVKVGDWLVLNEVPSDTRFRKYLCRCSCGFEKTFTVSYLGTGQATCCRSCQLKRRDEDAERKMVGRKRGSFTVKSRAGSNSYGSRLWLCQCECGREGVFSTGQVLSQGQLRMTCAACYVETQEEEHRCYYIPPRFWSRLVRQAERRNIRLVLTLEEAQELYESQDRRCALSGESIHFTTFRANFSRYTTASLDRISSTGAYEKGNVQWVHKAVNLMKGMLSQEEFVSWCHRIAAQGARS